MVEVVPALASLADFECRARLLNYCIYAWAWLILISEYFSHSDDVDISFRIIEAQLYMVESGTLLF